MNNGSRSMLIVAMRTDLNGHLSQEPEVSTYWSDWYGPKTKRALVIAGWNPEQLYEVRDKFDALPIEQYDEAVRLVDAGWTGTPEQLLEVVGGAQ